MRTTQFFLSTLREPPIDAEIISHQLMLRAGLIKKLSSGLYSWLPTGLRVLRKVEKIVREEMNRTGALELVMPIVQPSELWHESQRFDQYGRELLKFKDRHQRDFCLGPTHEEVITDIARQQLQSYKQLPLNFYQIQTKFRDEIRPRFGVMRAREFIMKDAYSFHIDQSSLEETYQAMYQAYSSIFQRLDLDFRPVLADTGSIGGSTSHEFHVIAETGEDALAISDSSDYAANVELAEAITPEPSESVTPLPINKVETRSAKTISEVCEHLNIEANEIVKCLLVEAADTDEEQTVNGEATPTKERGLVALIIRGDHSLNEIKAEKHPLVHTPLTFASSEMIESQIGCLPGSIGPCGLMDKNIPILVDRTASVMANFTCGANEDDFHLQNVNWKRDADYKEVVDLREVVAGDPSPDGKGTLLIKRGIEVGHIFQLGRKYSEAMNATVLDQSGKPVVMTMGCYGIGVSRIVAAAIEQNHDQHGIIWPQAMAPFQVAIVGINAHKSEQVAHQCEQLLSTFEAAGIEVIYDDRDERPGVKFADMELIGIPHRIVVSDKTLKESQVEYTARLPDRSNYELNKQKQLIPLEQITSFINERLRGI